MSSFRFFSVLLFLFCIYCCKKVDVAGPQGPQGPDGSPANSNAPSGTITGKILLYDSLGNLLADNSGASVTLENTSPVVEGQSGADGIFSIPNVKAGNYNLLVSKPGYGTMRIYNLLHAGGINPTPTGNIEIAQQVSSNFDIKKLIVDTINDNSFRYMQITLVLAHPQNDPRPVILYVNGKPGITREANDYNYWSYYFPTSDSTLVFSQFTITPPEYADKFRNEDYVYMAAAIVNPHLYSYTDSSGSVVYPATGNLSNEIKVPNIFK